MLREIIRKVQDEGMSLPWAQLFTLWSKSWGGYNEELALACSVLTSEAGGTTWIMKNLRTCEDCYLVMKMAMKVVKREIFVRDNMRLHHFRNEECFCDVLWWSTCFALKKKLILMLLNWDSSSLITSKK